MGAIICYNKTLAIYWWQRTNEQEPFKSITRRVIEDEKMSIVKFMLHNNYTMITSNCKNKRVVHTDVECVVTENSNDKYASVYASTSDQSLPSL